MPEAIVEIEDKETPVERQLRSEDDLSLMAYLSELSADVPMKVTVIRKVPKAWGGRNIDGSLETFDEPISEEQIREMYGGGTYQLKIQRRDNKTGNWRHFTSRTIKLAGDPKLDSLITTADGHNKGGDASPSTVNNAMKMAADLTQRANERAERLEERVNRPMGPDPSMLMLRDELSDLRKAAAEKDERIFALMNKDDKLSPADAILGKMLEGESARMTSLRTQVDSEIRTINERHNAMIDRIESRHERQIERAEDAHKRELDALIRSQDATSNITKLSYEGQMDGLKREIQHLASQLEVAQAELGVLRATKNKSPLENITEIVALKDAVDSLGGGKDEAGGTVERIITGVMSSPLVEGIGTRLAAGAVDATAPPQHATEQQVTISPEAFEAMEIDTPVKLPDGTIVAKRADGQLVKIRKKPQPPTPTGEGGIELDPDAVSNAVQFLEAACSNETDPAQFAASARSLVPPSILASIRAKGVDHFLANVAKIEEGSILNTQHGRNWIKKVATILLGSG
jgi:hypothetical protein